MLGEGVVIMGFILLLLMNDFYNNNNNNYKIFNKVDFYS